MFSLESAFHSDTPFRLVNGFQTATYAQNTVSLSAGALPLGTWAWP